ncbi:hypothetical protein D3C80_2150040 [compost metagenome]
MERIAEAGVIDTARPPPIEYSTSSPITEPWCCAPYWLTLVWADALTQTNTHGAASRAR